MLLLQALKDFIRVGVDVYIVACDGEFHFYVLNAKHS